MKKMYLLILLCIFLPGCSILSKGESKTNIFTYVETNHEKMEGIIAETSPDTVYFYKSEVELVLGKGTIVEQISFPIDDSKEIVEFSCRGSGLATNSIYIGFYYSADDTPYPIIFANSASLSEIGTDVYEWENEDGTHKLYTERIMENWFYYWVQWF